MAVALSDNEAAIRDLMAAGGYGFPLMLDQTGVGRAYGIEAIPSIIVIGPAGKIARTITGTVSADDLAELVGQLTYR